MRHQAKLKAAPARDWLFLKLFDESTDKSLSENATWIFALALTASLVGSLALFAASFFLFAGAGPQLYTALVVAVGAEMIYSGICFLCARRGAGANHLIRACAITLIATVAPV